MYYSQSFVFSVTYVMLFEIHLNLFLNSSNFILYSTWNILSKIASAIIKLHANL